MKKLLKPQLLIAIVLLLLLIFVAVYFFQKPKATPEQPQPALVQVKAVTEQNVPLTVSALGNVLSPYAIMLKTKQSGVITKKYFKAGDTVKTGQLLLTIDNKAQQAQLAQEEAQLWEANLSYQRELQLSQRDKGAVSQMQLDSLLSKVKLYQADVDYAKKQLNDTYLRAPFTGIISAPEQVLGQTDYTGNSLTSVSQINIGAYVNAGTPIALLVDKKDLQVSYPIPEKYSASLKLGQSVTVSSVSWPGKTFNAKVSYISPNIDSVNRNLNVRAKLDNGVDLLKSGGLIMAKQVLQAKRQEMLIPAISLIPDLYGYSVYLVKDNKAILQSVTTGERHNDLIVIKSGLALGDNVVVAGQDSLKPNQAVKVVTE